VTQLALACASEQGLPHVPQSVSVLRRVSQPSLASELQFANPDLHDPTPQTEPLHFAVPFAMKQAFPQPPQFAMSEAVSTSQPSDVLALQSASVPVHADRPQLPPTQFGVPPVVEHVPLQLPQCSTLLVVSVSQPFDGSESQSSKPAVHETLHAPSAHVPFAWLLEQGCPHAPQFAALVSRFVSQPSEAMPLQSPNPGSHFATPQTPSVHAGVA
jgi:hypothetical protein